MISVQIAAEYGTRVKLVPVKEAEPEILWCMGSAFFPFTFYRKLPAPYLA